MADISRSIQNQERMMAALNSINAVLSSVVSSFEAVQSASSSAVNTGP